MAGREIYAKEDKVDFNLARLRKGGENFEIAIDSDRAIAHRQGRPVDIKEVLKSENIYSDARKGLLASDTKLKELFNTDDPLKVAEEILRHGEIQLTAEYRAKLREQKWRSIIEIIHRNAVDPTTHFPHPAARIEAAMEQAKVKVDELKTAEEQVQQVLDRLKPIIPIKFEMDEISIKIPSEHAVKMYSTVKSGAKILSEDWQKDGSWLCVVELPAGLKEEFFEKLNKATKGNVEINIIKTK